MVPRFYKRPWIIIAVCAALTAFFAVQLPRLKIENDVREYLPHKDASYQRLLQSDEDFGGVYIIGVSLETEEPSFLTPENIAVVNDITKRVEGLDFVDKVDSLSNIDYVCSQDGSLVATDLIDASLFEADGSGAEWFVGTEEDIAEIRQKLIGWDEMYDRVIISDDGHASQMQITLMSSTMNSDGEQVKVTGNQRMDVLHQVKDIVAEVVQGTNLKWTVYGDPVISDDARAFMLSDLVRLIPLVIIVVIVCLFFSFKTVDGTLLPLLTVLMSTVWSCGLMAMFGVQFTIVSSVIPVALIAVGSAYGIHVLTHYYIALEKIEGPMTKELHAEAVWEGIKDVSQAVVLAGITTIVGFISLVSSPIGPLHSFAIFTSLGVVFSLVLAVVFIPAMLMIKPLSKVGKKSKRMEAIIARTKSKAAEKVDAVRRRMPGDDEEEGGSTYYKVYKFFAGTKARLVLFSAVIVVLSAAGVKKLVIDTALINYFPETSKLRRDVDYVNKRFAGTNSVYMIVSADDGLNMTNPEILKPLEDLQQYLQEQYPDIGKVVSFTTFVKRMNQVMNGPDSQAPAADAPALTASDDFGGGFGDFDGFDDGFGGFDSFDGAEEGSAAASVPVDFVNPNIAYSQQLA
ncbi:MAG: MMPL family transporter, partial [Treponemataceae bacterium]|nr:MMPL family transporter [Treponemataceae bacterium]